MGTRPAARRIAAVLLLSELLCSPTWAQDAAHEPTARTQTSAPSHSGLSKAEMWAGAALIVGGVVTAFYGFGHPTGAVDAQTVLNEPGDFPHRRSLGFAGIGIAAGGLGLAWHGLAHTTVKTGPNELIVQRRFSF